MFWVGLVAYIFHEMDGKFKDVPSTKAEHNEEKWELGKTYPKFTN